jgi:DNA (cytosine-5)-methyltransferase 1
MIYANEYDPKAAHWLTCLPLGIDRVDSRSIHDVTGADLDGYTESHFFAGIGGWPLALRMAGWPADELVWTGSCPCQPFSAAGKGRGFDDDRHLWPEFLRLIAECKPPTVFGEQVASKAGREWLAVVRLDLEELGYAVGAADLCAASVGAPHIRQRLFWVAHATCQIGRRRNPMESGDRKEPGRSSKDLRETAWPDGFGSISTLGVTDVLSPSYGIPGRVAQLRGLGNAIVPQVAAEFVKAFMDTRQQ